MQLRVYGEIEGVRCAVGLLETVPGREEQFTYDEAFFDVRPNAPLSVALPVRHEPYSARQVRAFFRNLLPEGAALAAVARKLEVKSSSYLKVLNALGDECIGAVVVQSESRKVGNAYGFSPVSRSELGAAFDEGAVGVASLQEEAKLSLAGAQSKMGLYLSFEDGRVCYAVPQGSAASTHIVKAPNRRFDQLSENEHYCLRLARAAGLDTAASFIDVLDGQPLFVTARFDRVVLDEPDKRVAGDYRKVVRLHQEDFCQVLGKLPEKKYEGPGQHYARQVRDALYERSANPVRDVSNFAKLLIVNVILGNCDGHLKNITVLRGADWRGFSLAPVYDIASTVVYQGLDRHLAMRLGGASVIDNVTRDDIFALGKELSLSSRSVAKLLDEASAGIGENLRRFRLDLEAELAQPLPKLAEVENFARHQIDKLAR